MSPHAPNRFVSFPIQVLMTKVLRINVVDLKGAMMNMGGWVRAQEEAVMINVVCSTVDMCEESDILFLTVLLHVQEITRHDIEVRSVEVY